MKPFHAISRKDDRQDGIAFDNPDDAPEPILPEARGYEETMVVVDNPDDFPDEGEKVEPESGSPIEKRRS
ncbi:hypothetical protein [Tumebacillus lipolyticus]|uniref:Uncharacterized protein n=1 Tax=Tumebacillus lipolyticus TaxID=1280370 RepID=A0ABW4ZTW0_9BACL